jgi:YD repeat-containing protein
LLDGNFATLITSELGTVKVEPEFEDMDDKTDSRMKLASITVHSPEVTNLDGASFVATTRTVFGDNGREVLEISADGVSTAYEYDNQDLVKSVRSGPVNSDGTPNMSHPASYLISYTRDPITAEIIASAEGDPVDPKITHYTYDNGALTEVVEGISRVKYYYNIWGELAATQVRAVDSAGNPFANGARTEISSYTIRDSQSLRVIAKAVDGADPRAGAPQYLFTRYAYNPLGDLQSVTPPFGHSTHFTYNGWGEVKSVHRGSATGLLLAEYLKTPSSTTQRVLSGEDPSGAPTYRSTTHQYSHEGYLTTISSSDGRHGSIVYADLGQVSTAEAFINGTRVAKHGAKYDQWGREVESIRYNPATDESETMSSILYEGTRVKTIFDKRGNPTTTKLYGIAGELLSVISPTSRKDYAYQPFLGVVNKVTTTDGSIKRVFGYEYNNTQQVVAINDLGDGTASPVTTSFVYDSLGRSTLTLPDGRSPKYFVDALGRTWASILAGERMVDFNYAINSSNNSYTISKTVRGEGTITAVLGPNGPISTRDTDGRNSTFTYSANGFPTTITGPTGAVMTVKRDTTGRRVGFDLKDASGIESWHTNYDPTDRAFEVVRTKGANISKRTVTRFGDYSEALEAVSIEPGRAPISSTMGRTAPDGRYEPESVQKVSIGGATWGQTIDPATGLPTEVTFEGGAYTKQNPLKFTPAFEGSVQTGMQYPPSTGIEMAWTYARGVLKDVAVSRNNQPIGGVANSHDQLGRIVSQSILGGGTSARAFDYIGDKLREAKEGPRRTQFTYDSLNPQQLATKTLPNGRVINYVSNGQGAYRSIDGMDIKYDALGRVTVFGQFSYEYEGTRLTPSVVKTGKKIVRKFSYDMAGALMATEDARGNRVDYLIAGTRDVGLVDPATGLLKRAYVNFPHPATPREQVASIDLTPVGKDYFYTNLSGTERQAAFDKNGNLVEQYSTNYGEGSVTVTAPNGAVRSSSVVDDDNGFHGLKYFTDAGPGGLIVAPLRAFLPLYSFALAPDPLAVTAQKYTFNDNDSVNKMDPTGGQAGWFSRAADHVWQYASGIAVGAGETLWSTACTVGNVAGSPFSEDCRKSLKEDYRDFINTVSGDVFDIGIWTGLASESVVLYRDRMTYANERFNETNGKWEWSRTLVGGTMRGTAQAFMDPFTGGKAIGGILVGVATGKAGIDKIKGESRSVVSTGADCTRCKPDTKSYLTQAFSDPTSSLKRAEIVGLDPDGWVARAQNSQFSHVSPDGSIYIPLNPNSTAITTLAGNNIISRLSQFGDALRRRVESGNYAGREFGKKKWEMVYKYGCDVKTVGPSLNVTDLETAKLYFNGKIDPHTFWDKGYNKIYVLEPVRKLVENGDVAIMTDVGAIATISQNAVLLVEGKVNQVKAIALYEPFKGPNNPGSWSMPD